jgi:hypothetical protein
MFALGYRAIVECSASRRNEALSSLHLEVSFFALLYGGAMTHGAGLDSCWSLRMTRMGPIPTSQRRVNGCTATPPPLRLTEGQPWTG